MQRLKAGVFLVLVAVLSSGCYISVRDDGPEGGWADGDDWERRQRRNQESISYLELGRTVDSVTAELGTADFTESFVRNGQTFRVLFYRTHRVRKDGRTTRDETTPLVFVDGELVGWGESAVENALP